jgi:hypothetical protein
MTSAPEKRLNDGASDVTRPTNERVITRSIAGSNPALAMNLRPCRWAARLRATRLSRSAFLDLKAP